MHALIRYTVLRDRLEEHLTQVREVYAELHGRVTDDFTYATYQLEDGVSFVELLVSEQGPAALAASPAFARFRASLDERCERAPDLTELREVGSVNLGPVGHRSVPD